MACDSLKVYASRLSLVIVSFLVLISVVTSGARADSVFSDEVYSITELYPGIRAKGMGGAFIAVANDTSAPFWNPAGLTRLNRPETNLEIGLGLDGTQWLGAFPTANNWKGSIGISSPVEIEGGLKQASAINLVLPFMTSHEVRNFESTKMERVDLVVASILGAWATEILVDALSVGGSLKLHGARSSIRFLQKPSAIDHVPENYGGGIGLNVGTLIRIMPQLSLGAVFNSPLALYWAYPDYDEEGFARDGQDIVSQWNIGSGIALQPTEALTLAGDVLYNRWGGLVNEFPGYENGLEIHAGGEYIIEDQAENFLYLRGGYYFSPSKYQNNNSVYYFDKQNVTAGIGYEIFASRTRFDLYSQYSFASYNLTADPMFTSSLSINFVF